jgi:hypothetical protein
MIMDSTVSAGTQSYILMIMVTITIIIIMTVIRVMTLVGLTLTRAQASVIHNYARLTFKKLLS